MIASLFKKKHRFSLSRALGVLVALVGFSTQGCIGDEEGIADGGLGGESNGIGEYEPSRSSLKVYIKDDSGDYQKVEIRVAPPGSVDEEGEDTASKEQASRLDDGVGQKEQASVDLGLWEAGVTMPIDNLLLWIGDTCRLEVGGVPPAPFLSTRQQLGVAGGALGRFSRSNTWSGSGSNGCIEYANWYNTPAGWSGTCPAAAPADMDKPLRSCDHVLYVQSQLLCTANKLAEIADATGTVKLVDSTKAVGHPSRDILIPPQSTADRQFVRRLVNEPLAALASLGMVDLDSRSDHCGELYSWSINDPVSYNDSTDRPIIFASDPGSGTTLDTFKALIRSRVRTWVENHRAALMLLKKNNHDMVDAGIATAEGLLGEGGLKRMWGSQLSTVDISLRAVLARQLGRIELDSITFPSPANSNGSVPPSAVSYYEPKIDPACADRAGLRDIVGEQDIVDELFSLAGARAEDPPPRTVAQQRAQLLAERLGVVLLPTQIKAAAAGQLRTLIREQLVRHDHYNLLQDNPSLQLLAVEADRGPLYDKMLEDISDADIAFALKGQVAVLAQLTEMDWPVTTLPGSGAGLYNLTTPATLLGPTLIALSGKIYSMKSNATTGIPRSALATDSMALAMRAQAASQCAWPGVAPVRMNRILHAYQSPGDAAVKLIDQLSEVVNDSSLDLSEIQTFDPQILHTIRVARAEYFGSELVDGLKHIDVLHANTGSRIEWRVRLHGNEADYPVQGTLDNMTVALIYGRPWEADCLAGTRSVCGANFAPRHRLDLDGTPPAKTLSIFGHSSRTWTFLPKVGTSLPIVAVNPGDPLGDDMMYVVRLPVAGGLPGRVLGGFRPIPAATDVNMSNRSVLISLSRSRDEAVQRVLNMSGMQNKGDRCVEGSSTGIPAESCVPGIFRNQYVPLANELTTDGGSIDNTWRHYLELARSAAAEADGLGQELISLGLERDLRIEGAQDELAGLCGTFIDTSDVDLSDGSGKSIVDDEVNACTDPPKTRLVFFQSGESGQVEPTEVSKRLNAYCAVVPTGKHCDIKNNLTAIAMLQPRTLGLPPPPGPELGDTVPGCNPSPKSSLSIMGGDLPGTETYQHGSLAGYFKSNGVFDVAAFQSLVGTEPYSRTGLAGAVSRLNFVEKGLDAPAGVSNWVLYGLGDLPLLSGASVASDVPATATSEEHKAWPLCRRIPGGPCSPLALAIERSFMGDGTPAVNQALDDRIRRAVEAGLWSMARVSGHLPSGLFTKVLPVANYGSANVGSADLALSSLAVALSWFATSGTGISTILGHDTSQLANAVASANFQAPVPSIYSYGLFSKSGSTFTLREGHAAADAETLGTLRNLPSWYSQRWLTIGVNQPRLLPFFVEATTSTPLVYSADKFLGLRASNASMAFGGGPEKAEVGENIAGVGNLPFYSVAEWLDDALNSSEVPNPAWEAMRRSILTGNRPGGSIDLVRDGILYSHVVARPEQCGQEAKDANLGDILPEHAGMQASDGAYVYKSLGDSWPAAFAKRNPVDRGAMNANDTNPPQILRDNGEDGMYRFEGVLFTDLVQIGYCSSTTCSDAKRGTDPDGDGKYTWPRIKGRYSLEGRVRLQQASDDFGGSGDFEPGAPGCKEYDSEFTADLLSASVWPPSKRVHMFVDPGSSILDNVAMMGALSCLAQTSLKPQLDSDVPEITDVRQIPLIRQWVDNQARQIARWQESLFLTDVPTSVVDHFANGTVNFSEVGSGETGAHSLELAQSFLEIHAGFTAVYDAIRRASAALRDAETSMAGAEISGDSQLNQVAMQRAQTIGGMVKATISAAGGILGAAINFPAGVAQGVTQAATGYADLAIGAQTLEHVNESEVLAQELIDNSKMQILQRMSENAASAMTDAQNAMVQIQTAHLNALRAQNALESVAGNARLQMARATGADFADVDGDGNPDALPVNTVYRRSYDILQRRYEEALSGAKRYAYLARLSIEQKLGVRLRSVEESVGPVPPPNGWADSLCQLTGVDYDKLRAAADPDQASEEDELIDDFADQYIGDYVRQLEEFVEFYNVKYPFREEDDSAVLSLRDDLVYGDRACRREARNLLYYSDRLGSGVPETDGNDPHRSVGGWRIGPETFNTPLNKGSRLAVLEAVERPFTDPLALTQPVGAPYPTGSGSVYTGTGYLSPPKKGTGVSILRTDQTNQRPMSAEYGPVPPLSTYQTVPLFGGTLYLLSWYDMARNALGAPTSSNVTYRVMVTDANWTPVAILDPTAAPGGAMDNVWSDRRLLSVYIEESGDYHVIISPVTTGTTGAVAIANVQLEAAVLDGPQDYEATTGTREINAFDCGKGNGKMLRDSFVRRCDAADDCFYELAKPISLHEGRIASGEAALPGLAADNFNYRHAGLAINVVGTGVLDCSNSDESCFSQGFLEYDLIHSAFKAELRDHADEPRCFNFGRGATRHGKALVAERYLGVPMSSTDREFLQSNEFMQEALTGRPLSGQYNLRIYETPELRWEQIEDIQLYLQYGYWSRVETAQ